MLFLIFNIARKRYAIQAEQIIEVLPNLTTTKLDSSTPDFFAGFIDYRGEQLPVIDLSQLLNDTSCPNLLSSRIILMKYPFGVQKIETIGLLAEKVTETMSIKRSDETTSKSQQFKELIESQLSEPNKAITLFDPLNALPASLNQLLSHL